MSFHQRSRLVPILVLTPLMVAGLSLGAASPAHAATVTSLVFNNVSHSAALNADPGSWAQVDDLTVAPGSTLYLPSSADVPTLTGWFVLDDAAHTHQPFQPADYTVTAGTTAGDYTLRFSREGVGSVTVRESATVPSMFITTGSGLAAIEADKDFRDTGATMAMIDAQASPIYNNPLAEMKGRGNTTWSYPKKPYQIKLGSNTELVSGAGAAKTWILLANYLDASLVRNELAYNLDGDTLVRAGAPDYGIKGRMLDLFIDGGFRGSYYLTEKVQVGPTRVAITDLEKLNETDNPSLSLGDVTPVKVTSLSGAPGIREAQYVPFPNTPSSYKTSGYLFEMDFASGSRGERSYVITNHGTPFTVTSPENANLPEVTFVGNYLQRIEDAIYSSSGKNAAGESFSDLIDVASWARYYVVQEMLGNDDGFKSSTYFYMDQGGKLKAGPLWDCDRSLGSLTIEPPASNVYVADPSRLQVQWVTQLMQFDLFRSAVQQASAQIVRPAIAAILTPTTGKLAQYAAEVSRSAVLNRLRWAPASQSVAYATPAENIAYLRTYLTQRDSALGAMFAGNYVAGAQLPKGYYTIKNGALTLDVASSSFAPGANVQAWTPNSSGAQTYLIERGADSLYRITNVNSLKALDVKNSVAADGTNVQQYTPNATLAQKWRISTFDGRNYTVVSAVGLPVIVDRGTASKGYVLDVANSGTTPGTNVDIYTSNGSAGQRFTFTRITLAAPPTNGGVYVLASRLNTAKVLDVAHASALSGANIQLWSANGTKAQRFTAKTLSNGTTEFWTGTGGGVMDVKGSGTTNGTNVWQWKSNGTAAQQWLPRPTGDLNGSYYLVSRVNGLYVDVAHAQTTDGTNVWVWQGNATWAQKFMLQKVG